MSLDTFSSRLLSKSRVLRDLTPLCAFTLLPPRPAVSNSDQELSTQAPLTRTATTGDCKPIFSRPTAALGGDILKYRLSILSGDHRVIQSNILAFVLVDSGVAEAGILIALKLV